MTTATGTESGENPEFVKAYNENTCIYKAGSEEKSP